MFSRRMLIRHTLALLRIHMFWLTISFIIHSCPTAAAPASTVPDIPRNDADIDGMRAAGLSEVCSILCFYPRTSYRITNYNSPNSYAKLFLPRPTFFNRSPHDIPRHPTSPFLYAGLIRTPNSISNPYQRIPIYPPSFKAN